jgi:hypothetical protein
MRSAYCEFTNFRHHRRGMRSSWRGRRDRRILRRRSHRSEQRDIYNCNTARSICCVTMNVTLPDLRSFRKWRTVPHTWLLIAPRYCIHHANSRIISQWRWDNASGMHPEYNPASKNRWTGRIREIRQLFRRLDVAEGVWRSNQGERNTTEKVRLWESPYSSFIDAGSKCTVPIPPLSQHLDATPLTRDSTPLWSLAMITTVRVDLVQGLRLANQILEM